MLSKLGSHARHNVVGYLALFFALTGVAYAAGPLKAGDPAGGDLTGTYPNPSVASSIARDSEIFPTVVANDGSASNLDADKLDGLDSAALAATGGLVVQNGSISHAVGGSFTVTKEEESGSYTLSFPAETLNGSCPVVSAIPFTPFSPVSRVATTLNFACSSEGSDARVLLQFRDLSGTPQDTSFMFTAL